MEDIIADACQDNFCETEFQEVAVAGLIQAGPSSALAGPSFQFEEKTPDEEPFDDSDADPDYLEESESDFDSDIPLKKLRISPNKEKINKKKK